MNNIKRRDYLTIIIFQN